MNLKYSPCKSGTDTAIKVLSSDSIQIDGQEVDI